MKKINTVGNGIISTTFQIRLMMIYRIRAI